MTTKTKWKLAAVAGIIAAMGLVVAINASADAKRASERKLNEEFARQREDARIDFDMLKGGETSAERDLRHIRQELERRK